MTRRELMKRAAVAAGVVAGPALAFEGVRRYHGAGDWTRIILSKEELALPYHMGTPAELLLRCPELAGGVGYMLLTKTPGPHELLVQGWRLAEDGRRYRGTVPRHWLPDVQPFQFTPFEVGDRVRLKTGLARVAVPLTATITAKLAMKGFIALPEGQWAFELDGGKRTYTRSDGSTYTSAHKHTWASMTVSYDRV